MDITLWSRWFSSISGFDSDSRPQFRIESVQRFIYFNKIEYFVHRKSLLASRGNRVYSVLIGDNLMKQMLFFNFGFWFDSRPQFRIESVQRFIYFNKLNTLSTREEFVSFKGNRVLSILIGHNIMKQMIFLQFRVLTRILEPISSSNQFRDSFILIKLNTLSTREEFCYGQSIQFIKINESLNWFNTELGSRIESKPEIEEQHLLH